MAGARVFVSRRIFQKALDMFDEGAEIDLWEDELPISVIQQEFFGIFLFDFL